MNDSGSLFHIQIQEAKFLRGLIWPNKRTHFKLPIQCIEPVLWGRPGASAYMKTGHRGLVGFLDTGNQLM